jgi:hypothetical protein
MVPGARRRHPRWCSRPRRSRRGRRRHRRCGWLPAHRSAASRCRRACSQPGPQKGARALQRKLFVLAEMAPTARSPGPGVRQSRQRKTRGESCAHHPRRGALPALAPSIVAAVDPSHAVPTVPTGLVAVGTSSSATILSWNASSVPGNGVVTSYTDLRKRPPDRDHYGHQLYRRQPRGKYDLHVFGGGPGYGRFVRRGQSDLRAHGRAWRPR